MLPMIDRGSTLCVCAGGTAACGGVPYCPDGTAVTSLPLVMEPFIGTTGCAAVVDCSGGAAGGLLSGTSAMFAPGVDSAGAVDTGAGFGCCAALTSLGSKPWISEPMTK